MRITIIGSGALACLFGAHLSTAAQVCLLGTWKEALTTIERRGIRVDYASGSVTARVMSTTDENAAYPSDLVLVLVKGWQTERAAQQASRVLDKRGLAITLQNGLGNYETLEAWVGPGQASLGVTTQGAEIISPGYIRHAGGGDTHLGITDHTSERLYKVAELLNISGIPTRLTNALDQVQWGKLAASAGINALTALLRIPNGELLTRPDAEQLMLAATRETVAVAKAKGITLPFDPDHHVREVVRATALNHSSMYQDIARQAPTEIDTINEAIVHEAAAVGLSAPVNKMLAQLVRATRSIDYQVQK